MEVHRLTDRAPGACQEGGVEKRSIGVRLVKRVNCNKGRGAGKWIQGKDQRP